MGSLILLIAYVLAILIAVVPPATGMKSDMGQQLVISILLVVLGGCMGYLLDKYHDRRSRASSGKESTGK